jgi:glutamate N-acetyltransferase/amino-acid N-acetyltransferase
VARTTELTASLVAAQREQVLVASTGPIGITLPVEQVCSGITGAHASLGTDVEPFASSILTTDSCPKLATERAGDGMTIGVAKGAAMIAPNMATMLAFIVTDVWAPLGQLQEVLSRAVARTFNRISIDACESTNDSVFVFSTGRRQAALAELDGALTAVCSNLAEQIVRDAEGGTRLVRIRIEGAASEDVAARLGHAVAASALWRAAVGGTDPNWGRVLAALGSVERTLDMDRLQVAIGDETVFGAGGPRGDNRKAATAMRADEFTITCTLSEGNGSAEVLCPDLSSDYVLLNAGGTT